MQLIYLKNKQTHRLLASWICQVRSRRRGRRNSGGGSDSSNSSSHRSNGNSDSNSSNCSRSGSKNSKCSSQMSQLRLNSLSCLVRAPCSSLVMTFISKITCWTTARSWRSGHACIPSAENRTWHKAGSSTCFEWTNKWTISIWLCQSHRPSTGSQIPHGSTPILWDLFCLLKLLLCCLEPAQVNLTSFSLSTNLLGTDLNGCTGS